MPPRRKVPLTTERRAALEAELRTYRDLEQRATLDKYVRASFAYDAGMSLREIGEVFDISPQTANTWRVWGEQERDRRGRGDPDRSEEREQVG